MTPQLKKLYKIVDELEQKECIELLDQYYNVYGLRNIISYFMLENLDSAGNEPDIKRLAQYIKRAKKAVKEKN